LTTGKKRQSQPHASGRPEIHVNLLRAKDAGKKKQGRVITMEDLDFSRSGAALTSRKPLQLPSDPLETGPNVFPRNTTTIKGWAIPQGPGVLKGGEQAKLRSFLERRTVVGHSGQQE